jgi:hypothetical protein
MVIGLGVFTMSATDLYVEPISNSFELSLLQAEVGQMDMNGGAESCTAISGARSDVAQTLAVSKLSFLLDFSSSPGKSAENCSDVSAWLHGDNTKLILFVDPGEESLCIIVENASAFGPVTVKAAGFKETVALFEQEVIIDQLLLLLRSH